jgi:hypothetical protein
VAFLAQRQARQERLDKASLAVTLPGVSGRVVVVVLGL